MPYSKSKRVVRAYESYLAQLLEAQTNLNFPAKNPSRLGYKLREAIYASQFFDDTKQYANLLSKFLLRLKANAISAEIRDTLEYSQQQVIESLKSEVVLIEIDSISGIIGATIKHKADHMVFPAMPVLESYVPLENFCNKLGYNFELLEEGGLELIKK